MYVEDGRVGLRPAPELGALWGPPVPLGSPVVPCYRLSLRAFQHVVAVLGRDAGGADVVVQAADGVLAAGGFRVDLPLHPVDVEVLVDYSIVEVFAAGRTISFRVDPELDTSRGVRASGDGVAELHSWRQP
jgi:hypothetical protein